MSRRGLGWLMGCLLLCALPGCQPERGDSQLLQDRSAADEVNRIRQLLSGNAPLTPTDFESIQSLRGRFPDADLLADTYLQALYKRGDWVLLIQELRVESLDSLSLKHGKWLAVACFRLGEYAQLIEVTTALRKRFADDYDLLKLQAVGQLNHGQEGAAGELLDAHWSAVMARRDADAVVLRGRVHQRLQQIEPAIETFELALSWAPQTKTALLALSRIYYARGEIERAQALSERAVATQAQSTARSTEQLLLVDRLSKMQQAWEDQNYAMVLEYANSTLDQVEGDNRRVVLEYIIAAHTRLGETEAAAAVQAELEKLNK